MNKLLLLLLCAAPAFAASNDKPKKQESRMDWKGGYCSVTEPAKIVARTQAEWDALWKKIGKPAPSAVDFKKHVAVGVFLGTKPTGGFSIAWQSAPGKPNVVGYQVVPPSGMAIQALTQPWAVKLIDKVPGDVKIEELNE